MVRGEWKAYPRAEGEPGFPSRRKRPRGVAAVAGVTELPYPMIPTPHRC